MKKRLINTRAVQAGIEKDRHHGSVSVPVYNSSLFTFADADEASAIHNYESPGYFYSRLGNPTQESLERAAADLESGDAAIAFASGMAAISSTVVSNVKSGEHIVALSSMYSTTAKLFHFLEDRFGVEVTYIDGNDASNYAAAIQENTTLLWVETPSNPKLNITDLGAVADIAKKNGILTVADNTFATPVNQNPIDFGIDIVIHSATKYFGGHSDLSAGIAVSSESNIKNIHRTGNSFFGGAIAPQTAWLVLRGIKTLPLRVERQNENACALANMLSAHPSVKAVYYPGLPDHPNHDIAKKQMRGFGGMMSFDLGSADAAKRFVNALEVVAIATSLGGVESVIQHSASMTHATISPEQREKAGITDGLLRFSVGIEDKDDLAEDLNNALQSAVG